MASRSHDERTRLTLDSFPSTTLGGPSRTLLLTVATPGTTRPSPTFRSTDRRAIEFASLTVPCRGICARYSSEDQTPEISLDELYEVNDTPPTVERDTLTRVKLLTVHAGDTASNLDVLISASPSP